MTGLPILGVIHEGGGLITLHSQRSPPRSPLISPVLFAPAWEPMTCQAMQHTNNTAKCRPGSRRRPAAVKPRLCGMSSGMPPSVPATATRGEPFPSQKSEANRNSNYGWVLISSGENARRAFCSSSGRNGRRSVSPAGPHRMPRASGAKGAARLAGRAGREPTGRLMESTVFPG